MSTEEGFLEKEKKVRRDRRHNTKSYFDDDGDSHKRAGRKGHGRMVPVSQLEMDVDIDEDDPYADHLQDWKRYLK
jgi:hypothetical protein